MMKSLFASITLSVMASIAIPAAAQDFPAKTVTLILPTGTGTSMDTLGRHLGENLAKLWGQNVLVENRPGAGGSVGAAYVASASKDGYTLLFTTNTFTTTAATVADLPYDAIEDFQPVTTTAIGDLMLVGGTRTGTKTLQELIDYSKENTVFYGTVGPGSVSRFAAELLNRAAGVEIEPVTYPSSTEALVDIMGGRLDLYVGAVASIAASLDNEGISPLAISGQARSDQYPDVPTLSELGLQEAEMNVWWGVLAPAGTPLDVAEKINADIATVMGTDEAKAFLGNLNASPHLTSVEEFSKMVAEEITLYKDVAGAE